MFRMLDAALSCLALPVTNPLQCKLSACLQQEWLLSLGVEEQWGDGK